MRRGDWQGVRRLAGREVRGISAQLAVPRRAGGEPHRLVESSGRAFQGSIVLGLGFVLPPAEANALMQRDARNVEALPAHPDIVALFAHVEAEAGIAPVTIGRRVAAINHHHKEAGFAPPTARDAARIIAQMMAGVRRRYARKKLQKAPAEADVLSCRGERTASEPSR